MISKKSISNTQFIISYPMSVILFFFIVFPIFFFLNPSYFRFFFILDWFCCYTKVWLEGVQKPYNVILYAVTSMSHSSFNIRAVDFDMPKKVDESLVAIWTVIICTPTLLNSYKIMTLEL